MFGGWRGCYICWLDRKGRNNRNRLAIILGGHARKRWNTFRRNNEGQLMKSWKGINRLEGPTFILWLNWKKQIWWNYDIEKFTRDHVSSVPCWKSYLDELIEEKLEYWCSDINAYEDLPRFLLKTQIWGPNHRSPVPTCSWWCPRIFIFKGNIGN